MSAAKLTVLGSAGSHPGPARACSSYLVEHQGFRLLLDCGNGSVSNLLQRLDAADVDVILISHRHPDHWADLIGLHYALRFHPDGEQSVDVYGPEGLDEFMRQLLPDDDVFPRVCRFRQAAPGDHLELGPLQVTFFSANHSVTSLAPRIEVAGRVIAYSGDSDRTPALTDCARDADLFVCDATWPHHEDMPRGIHMSGRGAGEQAAEAGARRLLITHVWPGCDRNAIAREASDAYDGEVLVAEDLMEIEL